MNDAAKAWVAALRSGKYTQGKASLHTIDPQSGTETFCCLGVACKLYADEVDPSVKYVPTHDDTRQYPFDVLYAGRVGGLPPEVAGWLGMREGFGMGSYRASDGDSRSLAFDNDTGGFDFNQIAAIIESEPEGLFAE